MKIINPSYEILTSINGKEILKQIELATRICYRSEDNICEGSAEKLVKNIIERQHFTPLEHVSISVKLTLDRGVLAEITRHRHASFNVESTRYCAYNKDKFGGEITVIDLSTGFNWDLNNEKDYAKFLIWRNAMHQAENHYLQMLEHGATPDEARSVLPNSLKTEIVMTANLREWRHFFSLRAVGTTGKPHPQMREIAVPLLYEVGSKIPIIFDDLVEAMKEADM